jgi:circadian clock protein KaiB
LKGKYSLEIVDVYQQEDVAEKEQLIALPLLIKKLPFPERRMIGDLSDTNKVLKGLGLLT